MSVNTLVVWKKRDPEPGSLLKVRYSVLFTGNLC